VIARYKVTRLAAGTALIVMSGGIADRSAAVAGSGHTAHQSSQSTRGGATDVGYNLNGNVTRRVPIELKLCHFTLQAYTVASDMH
jgi:hypothetical protein